MKKKIKLAILLMATALIGVSQDQGLLTTSVENNHVVLADTKSKSKTTKKEDKTKVDAVTDTAKKGDFNNRINAVVSAIETKEAEEAAQAEEARKAEEARQAQEQAAAPAQQGDSTTVYITNTGRRYHLSPYCRGLDRSNSTTPTTLSNAIAAGYTRCKFE